MKSRLSGVGAGDLSGLGIEYMVVINAKASAAPPHIECVGDSSSLTKGKIFKLDQLESRIEGEPEVSKPQTGAGTVGAAPFRSRSGGVLRPAQN